MSKMRSSLKSFTRPHNESVCLIEPGSTIIQDSSKLTMHIKNLELLKISNLLWDK